MTVVGNTEFIKIFALQMLEGVIGGYGKRVDTGIPDFADRGIYYEPGKRIGRHMFHHPRNPGGVSHCSESRRKRSFLLFLASARGKEQQYCSHCNNVNLH